MTSVCAICNSERGTYGRYQSKRQVFVVFGTVASQGHCGIAIKKQEGWLFFCGDAYYSHLQLNPKNKLRTLDTLERIFAENNAMRLDNLHKIQSLAQITTNIEIICAHDPIELARYQP